MEINKRQGYSQNYLSKKNLVSDLIDKAGISKNDLVIDIGAGKGRITEVLLKKARKVIAIEIDSELYKLMLYKFKNEENLELVNSDFLKYKLPKAKYKVFANIPFNITADIIRKLTSDKNLQAAFLVAQKDAAKKFVGKPLTDRNSMQSILLKPWFDVEAFWQFKREDFNPRPNVEIVLLKIERKRQPLLPENSKKMFESFVIYAYTREKVSRLTVDDWVNNFDRFAKTTSVKQKKMVSQKASEFLKKQKEVKKIHRTRRDKNWRDY